MLAAAKVKGQEVAEQSAMPLQGPRESLEPIPAEGEPSPDTSSPGRYLPLIPGFTMHEENYFSWRFAQTYLDPKQTDGSRLTRVKLQISVRYELYNLLGWKSIRCRAWPHEAIPQGCEEYARMQSFSLAFAFTQKSMWDLFAFHRSAPFIESNYRPELLIVYRPRDENVQREVFLGIMHESNGIGLTPAEDEQLDADDKNAVLSRSRSWNNVFAGARWTSSTWWSKWSVAYGGRIWVPVFDTDPNDIAKYLGITNHFGAEAFGEVRRAAFYVYRKTQQISNMSQLRMSLRARARSLTIMGYFPLWSSKGWIRPSLYVQGFFGKAETLGTAELTSLSGYLGIGLL
jgi:hypothetical protein